MPLFVNRVMLAGNLTRDPQVRFFANERAVCDFGLAINRRYRGADGEQKEETVFVDVSAWGRTAELCGQYLSKGRNVHIEGRLQLDQWEAQDGSKRSKLKVNADNVNFIDSGNRAAGQGGGGAPAGRSDAEYGGGAQGGASASAPAVPPPADLGDDEPPF